MSEQTKARIVDDELNLHVFRSQGSECGRRHRGVRGRN